MICEDLIKNLEQIRTQKPLIYNLTNYVTTDFVANGILALGASPVMSHSFLEMEEMISLASSIVINIGTLDELWVPRFKEALSISTKLEKPVILDPVGAGATKYRTQTALDLLAQGEPIIKGNASEIMALNGQRAKTRGVDSQNETQEALEAARMLSEKFNTCVIVSGKNDIVYTREEHQTFSHGTPLMSKVTGMGCLLASVVGAFRAIEPNVFKASSQAVVLFGITGEIAASKDYVKGSASFRTSFLDQLYSITANDIRKKIKGEDTLTK